jgi:hypothetical protein
MPKDKNTNQESGKQTIEELTERYHALNEKKIQAQTNLKNAEKQLRELRNKAKEAYGTDDLDELKKQLEQLKADNEAKRAAYQATLEKIESDLTEVESKHGSMDGAEDTWDEI